MSTTSTKQRPSRRKPTEARCKVIASATWRLRRLRGVQILEAPSLAGLDWLVHGFSTRPGGVSELGTKSRRGTNEKRVLNLGFTDWDSRERVVENRGRFLAAIGAAGMRVATPRQVHSDVVLCIPRPAGTPDICPGDALITREPDVLLTVQTADCVPILLADTKRRAIAAIHSGWRGTLQRIAEKTLGRMQMEFGTDPRDVIAAVGPGIGRCCYEVGHEVVKEFAAQFPDAREWFDGPFEGLASGDNDPNWLPWLTMKPPGHAPPSPRAHLDLIAANRAILISAGVAPSKVVSSDLCTVCREDLFFSYRREGTTGRMMAAIGIRA
ncbi:MAG TPA: peptidoglycan editing factor PgeF [Candidatus Acidoferrum sp.]|nr:peptidoglycan editing factor PgeF [Candidatus Acidoferrum sp.]